MTATIEQSSAPPPSAPEPEIEAVTVEPVPAGLGMVRPRILTLFVIAALVGAAAGAIFDEQLWVLVVAPALPAAVAALVASRSVLVRLTASGAAVVGAVAGVVAIEGGGPTDVVDAFTDGPQRLLSTEWPSPLQPDLVGTVAAGLALAMAVAAELAGRRRWHLLPLAPLIIAYVAVVGLSAPAGVDLVWLFAIAVVSIVFTTLRNDGTLREQVGLLSGERRVLPLVAIAVGLAALVSIPVTLSARADPRQSDPPERTSPLLDPIEATLALRDLDPATTLHVVEADTAEVIPARWRTAALENYDGQRWTPALALRPIGRTLGVTDADVLRADVTFLDDSLTLVPFPGAPLSVDADVETDDERTVVRLTEPVEPGTSVGIVSSIAPTRADAAEAGVAARAIDDEASGFTELAEALGGDGSTLERLVRIETLMREDYVLDNDVQGGGLQRALVERFVRDTQRGTAEQFATSFVLLARSLGVDARVATGFVASAPATGTLPLTSDTASVWPEVRLNTGGWLPFDPVPEREASDTTPPPPEPQVQTPAAPQPPIAPPPESGNEATGDDSTVVDDDEGALATALGVVLRTAAGVGLLLLPLLAAAAVILGLKWRRRRRRLRADSPTERIRGAWASATDTLVDAGLTIPTSATDADIAADGSPLVGDADRELRRLASLSSAATFGDPVRPDLLVADATDCLHTVEATMGEQRTWWQRARWRLSLRSLRAATRSPVA
jgi:hypothetical protein